MRKNINKIKPLLLVILFLSPIKKYNQINSVDAIRINISIINSLEILSGFIIAPTPNISNKLNIHEPTRLPTAKSSSPFILATIDVTSSGNDVPKASIVNPIIFSLILKVFAIFIEFSTTKSPPVFNNIIPTEINSSDINK